MKPLLLGLGKMVSCSDLTFTQVCLKFMEHTIAVDCRSFVADIISGIFQWLLVYRMSLERKGLIFAGDNTMADL